MQRFRLVQAIVRDILSGQEFQLVEGIVNHLARQSRAFREELLQKRGGANIFFKSLFLLANFP